MEANRYIIEENAFCSAIGFSNELKATVIDITDKRWFVALAVNKRKLSQNSLN